MKVTYKNIEIEIENENATVIEAFKEAIEEKENIIACMVNNEVKPLNYVLKDKVKFISSKWNFAPYLDKDYYPVLPNIEDIYIIHYASSKPWDSKCIDKFYIEEFWKYFCTHSILSRRHRQIYRYNDKSSDKRIG